MDSFWICYYPPLPPDLSSQDFSIWFYSRWRLESAVVKSILESKSWISIAPGLSGVNILRNVWQKVIYRWVICRIIKGRLDASNICKIDNLCEYYNITNCTFRMLSKNILAQPLIRRSLFIIKNYYNFICKFLYFLNKYAQRIMLILKILKVGLEYLSLKNLKYREKLSFR